MRTEELLGNNPKATKLLREWYAAKMLRSLAGENIPKDFKDQVIEMGVTDKRLIDTIDKNPHALFEFFDEKEIFIRTDFIEEGSFFGCSINEKPVYYKFRGRKAAERDILDDAFEILEERL